MKIALVGYQGSGKSTLLEWLSGVAPDPSLSHTTQTAMATMPDDRLDRLREIFRPKKVVSASLELVDTPGLSRTHQRSAERLGLIREAGCLVVVVAAFDGSDPVADLRSFEEDVLLADLEIISGRVERLRESVKKPRPNREQEQAELELLEPILAALEEGKALRHLTLSEEQLKTIRSYQAITQKPRLVVVNLPDDEEDPGRFCEAIPSEYETVAVPLGLELELARMSPEDRAEFEAELGLTGYDRDSLLRTLLDVSGQTVFFTATGKELRSWLVPKNTTAVEAAGTIHSDMARGFIRAETITCDDMIRLGSERDVKAAGLVRQEPKDYLVQDGDILCIRFSV